MKDFFIKNIDIIIKNLDIIQIVGFILSIIVSLVLIITGQDSLSSVILGFVLAGFVQLLDIQKRHTDSEERVLHASTLSQALYRDEWLLKHCQHIVNDYLTIKSGQFALFQRRANYAIVECRNVLDTMAKGYLDTPADSAFIFSRQAFEQAEECLKATVAPQGDINWWRSAFAEKYFQQNVNACKRIREVTRVFIQPTNKLRDIIDILEKHRAAGIHVYIVGEEDLDPELIDDYLIMDNKVLMRIEFGPNHKPQQESISIDKVEVELAVMRFNALVRLATELDDKAIQDLKRTDRS